MQKGASLLVAGMQHVSIKHTSSSKLFLSCGKVSNTLWIEALAAHASSAEIKVAVGIHPNLSDTDLAVQGRKKSVFDRSVLEQFV